MNNSFPKIETERFNLRQFTDQDIENVYYGLSHPDVIKFYGVSFDSLEATKEQMNWFADLEKNEKGLWWAVCSKETGTFCGAGGLNDWDKEHRKAEIGFWLLPECWGKGIMKEVMPVICNFAFNQMGIHRIEGFVVSDNDNCKRAMAKLDFKYEGTMVDCEMKNDKFISVDIYALVDSGKNK